LKLAGVVDELGEQRFHHSIHEAVAAASNLPATPTDN
jgi:hypothetical protein